jgi:palmitoyl transferase
LFIFGQLTFSSVAQAEDNATNKGWFSTFTDNVSQTWSAPEHYDLYVPAITWHARFAYDKEKTDKYNERPWGLVLVSHAGMRKETGTASI